MERKRSIGIAIVSLFIIGSNVLFIINYFLRFSHSHLRILYKYFSPIRFLYDFSPEYIPIIGIIMVLISPLINIYLGIGMIFLKRIFRYLFVIHETVNCCMSVCAGCVWFWYLTLSAQRSTPGRLPLPVFLAIVTSSDGVN